MLCYFLLYDEVNQLYVFIYITSLFFFVVVQDLFIFFFVVNFVIHWNETAMGLYVFPIPIPRPTSLSTQSL